MVKRMGRESIKAVALFAAGIILASACALAASRAPSLALTAVVRQTMSLWFEGGPGQKDAIRAFAAALPAMKQYDSPRGVFVTLSRNGKTRACWGSVYPRHDNVRTATVYATLDALTKEYRYKPVGRGEWRSLKPQVTVVTGIEQIRKSSELNPLRDGLMMRAGSRSCVILPGEARDAHYQTAMCRLKAGLHPNEPAQLYRIQTDVYQ